MKVVSVFNYKGGVGKTTVTANLGAQLALLGKKVLLIDMDPQASLTFSFIRPDDWEANFEVRGTILTWFESFEQGQPISLAGLTNTPSAVSRRLGSQPGKAQGKLSVIYSHFDLIRTDRKLAAEISGFTPFQSQTNYVAVHRRLADALRQDFSDGAYDIVLIDCPPNLGLTTSIALVASDFFLIPTNADDLATLGITHLYRNVRNLADTFNHSLPAGAASEQMIYPRSGGVVFTMIDEMSQRPEKSQQNAMHKVRQLDGVSVFEAYIKRNNRLFNFATSAGVPVVLSKPSNGTDISVVSGLQNLAYEFLGAVGL